MKILCQEHYDKVVQYAKEIGDTSLDNCLKRLEQWENNPNCLCEIELYRDFAPHSFGFRECYPDGKTGIVGGLIYHGNPDRSYSVLLEPFHGVVFQKVCLGRSLQILQICKYNNSCF